MWWNLHLMRWNHTTCKQIFFLREPFPRYLIWANLCYWAGLHSRASRISIESETQEKIPGLPHLDKIHVSITKLSTSTISKSLYVISRLEIVDFSPSSLLSLTSPHHFHFLPANLCGSIYPAPVVLHSLSYAMAEEKYNLKNPAVKRILQEVKEMQSNPSDDFMGLPLEVYIYISHLEQNPNF